MTDPSATDPPAGPATIRDRLLSSGLSKAKVDAYLGAGQVRVNGEPVTDPNHPAPPPTTFVIGPVG
jgi:hypothetical protein